MAKKAELEKGPSPLKIGAGIAILFALAFIRAFSKDHIGMMPPNGSGKTTLFHTIMGLCRPDSGGKIEIFAKPVSHQV